MSTGVKRFPRNDKGRDFVVGDIHGAFDSLEDALARVKFDPERDRLFSVGDLADRGRRSPDCLHYLRQHWFHAVQGNHEDMFLKLFDVKGVFNHAAYANDPYPNREWIGKMDDATREQVRQAFSALPVVIEVETPRGLVGIVHAEVPPRMDWQTFSERAARDDRAIRMYAQWSRERFNANDNDPVPGVSRVFHGHTPSVSGIRRMGNRYYIDTGAVYRERGTHADMGLSLVQINAPSRVLQGPHDTAQPVRVYVAPRAPKP
jgi:serine/threonine protein phosphatase 1